jgi:hypothetical protein
MAPSMPQVIEFPPFGADPRAGISALVRVCKEVPEKGEPFRELRGRLRAAKLWDKDRPLATLRFLGVTGTPVVPSPFVRALAAAAGDDAAAEVVLDRLWQLNPVLAKTVIDLLGERPYGKDEIYKYLGSTAYKGIIPSRPSLETWLQIAIATGLIKAIGIAVAKGQRADLFVTRAAELDVDEYLAEDRPEPDPVIPAIGDDDAAPAAAPAAVAEPAFPESSIPVAAAAPIGPVLPSGLRHVAAGELPPARNLDRVVALGRFATEFTEDVLAETKKRIAAWWAEVRLPDQAWKPSDFGLDPEQWVENADEVVYRIAVAAALAFRLETDRTGVIRAYTALDRAGVLADLFHGTVPESLPAQVDARALMLASLAARRCAEAPGLAGQLDGQQSAAAVFATLDGALGRGLFRIELLWMMDMLAKLGVMRHADLDDYTVTPYRVVRDTLFRLGFVATPYAPDAAALAAASKAARAAAGPGPADEILAAFTVAAGCAYDCPHRKTCDYPCRERTE